MRRAARRDANENQLVAIAEQLGALWEQTGPLDGWTFWRGRWTPTEIKNPQGKNKYTDSQVLFLARCTERNAPVFTWRTESDVLKSLNATIAA
jgi:hypothetical protein